MSQNWIHEQADLNVTQFDESMEKLNDNAASYLHDADKYYERVCKECNYLDAAKAVDWQEHLKPNSVVLDMGSGGGWLSGLLSTYDQVASIYALDSSKYFLLKMMPDILSIMGSKSQKVIPVEGLFTPLLLKDSSIDLVVASSAIHHADCLESIFREINRVLKVGGTVVVLNETPGSSLRHLFRVSKACLKIFKNLIFKNYFPTSQSVSSGSFLYDSNLGDRAYPNWYWHKAIEAAGLKLIEQINTNMPTVKGQSGPSLQHFVCKKI